MNSVPVAKRDGHPRPRCHFGRLHSWSEFVYLPDHFACVTCGIEDDTSWWDGASYIGPAELPVVDLTQGGWGLRRRLDREFRAE